MVTRLQILEVAKRDVVGFFEESERQVFDLSQITDIISKNVGKWRLPQTITTAEFLAFFTERTKLREVRLKFRRVSIKYVWGNVPFYKFLLSIKREAYFSHYTAVSFHNLTDQIPKTAYVNVEQKPNPYPKGELEQGRIDWAFKRPTRISKNCAKYKGFMVYLLEGMFTANLGVIEMKGPEGENLRLTNLERTLIDITVRPEYSGGVYEVLRAYQFARDKVSINTLVATLKKLGYLYPYHQAIGFYLEKAGGYRDSQIKLLRNFNFDYDFYLVHQIKEPAYSSRWRLYYPKGIG